ncbi:MAG TPA: hypothetical protein PJ986_06380 [Gammaproteobacteria bacterium]|mgnify:CR=1 FL=1|nr:hypothetical protein [Gammaproteobacteria bacterium]
MNRGGSLAAAGAARATQRRIADLLFVIQVGCALVFGLSQTWRMLSSVEGLSPSWFLCWALFLVINLRLSIRAHRVQPSRVTKQTVWVYALWTTIIATNLAALAWHGAGAWTAIDDATIGIVLAGVAATLALGHRRDLDWRDPIVRGWLAVFFKGVPQLTLAWNLALVGGGGLAPLAVFAGHVTICTRLGQLVFSIREAGWDRNRTGSLISEIANEGSWIVATVVWLMV